MRHDRRGPIPVKVLSHGKDGFSARCAEGEVHKAEWDRYLGHRRRVLHDWTVEDQGADGAVVKGKDGRRRYVAGFEAPDPLRPNTEGKGSKADDPLLDGLARLGKAESLVFPDGLMLMLKGGLANRSGLMLKPVTDRAGHRTQRWTRTGQDAPKQQREGSSDDPPLKHGDVVSFRHGDVGGKGKIVGSGPDGVTLQDDAGNHHPVRHDALTGKAPDEAKAGDEKEGDQAIPPDTFDANDYGSKHNDPNVTAADILKSFPPDTESKIQETNKKLAGITQTQDLYKKDGQYTPERAAIHDKILAHFLSEDKVKAATPDEGQAPSFTILGGRGGSGKSWFAGKVYDPAKSIVMDADEIKGMLPEYEGWNAAVVHEESGDLFDHITDAAKQLGLNIVHDATMKAPKKAVALVEGFKDAGYRTEAHYMYLAPQEAAKRAVSRFLGKTRRFVPPGIVLGNTTNEGSFDQVKKMVDAWSFRDNNVAQGDEPRLISEKTDEADRGKPGRDGLPADGPADGGGKSAVAGGDADGKGESPLAKAFGNESARFVFLKAQIPGGAGGDLFAAPVEVDGHVRGGKYIAPYQATRHMAPDRRADEPEPANAKAPVLTTGANVRPLRADGRLAPLVGDAVFQTVAGPFGMPAAIHGVVYQGSSKAGLRVRVTGSAAMIGSAQTGKTYPMSDHWTVAGDPWLARRQAEREAKEAEAKAAIERERQEEEDARVALAAERGTLDPAPLALGDVIESPEGEKHLVAEFGSGGPASGLYTTLLDDPRDSPRGIGSDLRGWRHLPTYQLPEDSQHKIDDGTGRGWKQRIGGQWVPVEWDDDAREYRPIAAHAAVPVEAAPAADHVADANKEVEKPARPWKPTKPQIAAIKKAGDLMRRGEPLRDLYFPDNTLAVLMREGVLIRKPGSSDGLTLATDESGDEAK